MRLVRPLGVLTIVAPLAWLGMMAGQPAGASGTLCGTCVTAPETIYQINGDGGDPTVPRGYVELDIALERSAPARTAVQLSYATADGTAGAPADYLAVSGGTVTIAAGDTVGYARVLIARTALCAGRTFSVGFSAPSAGRLVNATTSVVIRGARCPSRR
jgi:Calx-beta domain